MVGQSGDSFTLACLLCAILLSSCSGFTPSSSDEVLNRLRVSGGEASFSLIDESRSIREVIEDYISEGALVFQPDGRFIGKIVPGCYPSAKYRFRGSTPIHETHKASQENSDGVSGLLTGGLIEADSKSNAQAYVKIVSVGRYILNPNELGERARNKNCDDATSILLEIEVGAWEFHEGSGNLASGSLGVGIGTGVESSSQQQSGTSMREGDFSVCELATRDAIAPVLACSVPLRAKVDELPMIDSPMSEDEPSEDEPEFPSREVTASAKSTAKLSGSYVCGSRTWSVVMQLSIDESSELFGIIKVSSGDLVGTWGLSGFRDEDGTFELDPTDSVDLPLGYSPLSFSGVIDINGLRASTDSSDCGEMLLQMIERTP